MRSSHRRLPGQFRLSLLTLVAVGMWGILVYTFVTPGVGLGKSNPTFWPRFSGMWWTFVGLWAFLTVLHTLRMLAGWQLRHRSRRF